MKTIEKLRNLAKQKEDEGHAGYPSSTLEIFTDGSGILYVDYEDADTFKPVRETLCDFNSLEELNEYLK